MNHFATNIRHRIYGNVYLAVDSNGLVKSRLKACPGMSYSGGENRCPGFS